MEMPAARSRSFGAGQPPRIVIGVLVWLALAGAVMAQHACDICAANVWDFSVYEDKYHHRNQFICDKCTQLTTRCLICRIFVLPARGLVLPDGRVYCREDSKDIVLEESRARELFGEARREVQAMLRDYPPVPDKNMEVHLVTREEFNKAYRRTPSIDDPSQLLGLTISRREAGEGWTHEIYILHGLTRDEFLAVCAHEYTHTWLTERGKKSRQLHKDTQEGFCELMAHKYTRQMNFTNATQRIMDSEYTHGQIDALLAAEEKLRFHHLVKWITDGVESWVDKDNLSRLAALRDDDDEPSAGLLFNPPPQAVTPVPDRFVLKGLSKVSSRRFAIINNATLAEGEEARVRLGSSNLIVRCVAIMDDRVQLRISGQTNLLELRLGGR